MARINDWKERLNVVYSTNPDFKYTVQSEEQATTLPPPKQELRIWLDRHHRGGKCVTLVRGFAGSADDLDVLATRLKRGCGVGGAAKAGEIVIQGDVRDRVIALLLADGYRARKAGG